MRKFLASVSALIVAMTIIVSTPTTANAGLRDCGKLAGYQYSPTWGAVITWTNLRDHRATFRLKMNASQIRTLRCLANYVELDFELRNSTLSGAWEGYKVSTDLPHGLKDTSYLNSERGNPRPSITNIHTKLLQAGRIYTTTISWRKPIHAYSEYNRMMAVRLSWQPSYWGAAWTPNGALCFVHGGDPRYCLFGFEQDTVKLYNCFFRVADGWLLFRLYREVTYKINHDFRTRTCVEKQ